MHQEHDVVVLRHGIPEHGLVADDVGAVVGVYETGVTKSSSPQQTGGTVAVVTLAEEDIRPRRRREILHVREVA